MDLNLIQSYKLLNQPTCFVYNQMANKYFTFVFLFFALTLSQIVPLHKYIAQQIFQQNKLYLIYVHGPNHNFQVEAIFNSYCFGDKLCAILDPNIQDYYDILQFVGNNADEYFLIIDSTNKRKYVLPIRDDTITQNDLLQFQYKFLNKQIDPFFASEPLPQQFNQKCTKLVGNNVGQYLRRGQRIKIILLYSLRRYCATCDKALAQFIAFAQDNYSQGEVAFGYFNTFLNDHPIIQDEKTPNMLIFIDNNYERPFELQGSNIEFLSTFIKNTFKKRQERKVNNQQL